MIGRAGASHPFCRRDDGPVAGAAAEIACERVVDPCPVDGHAVAEQDEKRHDEAGRTEAALGAVAINHGLLHRMELPCWTCQILDGQELLAVERGQELDAGIDRAVDETPVLHLAQRHGARPAVAFGAAFLAAGPAFLAAQIVENREGGVVDRDFAQLLAKKESDCRGHGAASFRDRWSKRKGKSAEGRDSAPPGLLRRSAPSPDRETEGSPA